MSPASEGQRLTVEGERDFARDVSPRALGFSMPAEWEPHVRTWMEFPPANDTFGTDPSGSLREARMAWLRVAAAIAAFEPVTMIARPGDAATAHGLLVELADSAERPGMTPSSANIVVIERPIDDAWFRDSGPSFVTNGTLGAVHWTFNAWGDAGFSRFDDERLVGVFAGAKAGARVFSSSLVNEGGGFHVDGDGTVLVTETVQLDPGRNPSATKESVERELREFLGVENVLWVPRGLTRDYERFGTRGHIDMFACFLRPGVVLAHVQRDPSHPDFEVCAEYLGVLRSSVDARGRRLEVVEIDAPETLHDDGGPVDWNYVNHYVCNGAVIACAFDDPGDERAREVLERAYPGRRVVMLDARPILRHGGGIHCITQQQPTTHGRRRR
jgi:agmatine deiminase